MKLNLRKLLIIIKNNYLFKIFIITKKIVWEINANKIANGSVSDPYNVLKIKNKVSCNPRRSEFPIAIILVFFLPKK